MTRARPSGPAGLADDAGLAGRARELLEQIAAQPRFAGGGNEKRARDICATLLEAEGMSLDERKFLFSEFPGRYGTPIVSVVLMVTTLVTRYVLMQHGPGPALASLALGMGFSGVVAKWLMRAVMPPFSGKRTESANLVAVRGHPLVWLIAHLDTKSQTLPMIARIGAIVLASATFVVLAISLAFAWLGEAAPSMSGDSSFIHILAIIAAATTVPLILCFAGNASPGAVDNASGVIAVLLATTLLRDKKDLGVILTSAEELGLAGARSYTMSTRFFSAASFESDAQAPRVVALNCDTVDDAGEFLCMAGRKSRGPAASALTRAAAQMQIPVRVQGLIPGVLADSIAFAEGGWDSLTLSRGNIATLARVHTSSDTREQLNGTGIAQAAYLLAATVQELT